MGKGLRGTSCPLFFQNFVRKLSLLFELELRLVFFHELLDVVCSAEKAVPLLVVQRHRKTAQAVDADATLLSDFENQVTAALLGFDLFFQLSQFRFEFLVTRFCHVASLEVI